MKTEDKPLSMGAHGGRNDSMGHMAHKARLILAAMRTKPDEDAARIVEGHFLQAHRPRKTRRRRRWWRMKGKPGPPDVDRAGSQESERQNLYRAPEKSS